MLELLLDDGISGNVGPSYGEVELLPTPTVNVLGGGFASCSSPDGKFIYYASGVLSNGTQNNGLSQYEIATKVWTKLTDLPAVASGLYSSLAMVGSKLYFIRSEQLYSMEARVGEVWTKHIVPEKDNWIHYMNAGQACFVNNGMIYRATADIPANGRCVINRYNPALDEHTTIYNYGKAAGVINMLYNSCAFDNNIVYMLGSTTSGDIVQRYNLTTGPLPNMTLPTPFGSQGFAFCKDGWLYYGGGSNLVDASGTALTPRLLGRMNLSTGAGEVLKTLPQSCYQGSGIQVEDKLYLYAGNANNWGSTKLTTLQSYMLPEE